MPVNLLITFVLGSALAWLIIKITRTPKHLQGIVIGCCSAGLKGSDVSRSVIIGIIAVRNIFLPLSGIGVVKAAQHFGLVGSDSLYQFVLLLQYAVPPAMSVGTMTQFFQLGQGETSVIMLWTYAVAAVTLTLWSTFFMWLLT
ncbi:Membrane transport protein - like 4 [Theobroma cacao]|nr:Membrane transport protein - like 4 [Theobroma cacao]